MRRLPRSARKNPRVLFYSHDGLGLGHFRQTLAVAESLARRVPAAARLLLTGLASADAFDLPKTLDYVRMPGIDKSGLYEADPGKEPGAPLNVFAVRKGVIAATFEGFAPHLAVVDHTPGGLAGELLPALKRRGRQSARPMYVLSLRDIIYGAEQTHRMWEADGTYELLEHVYDLILVHGSPTVFDPVREYQFPSSVAAKTLFTGYLRRPEPLRSIEDVRRELGASEAPLVVVSAGGGTDGAALLKAFLKAVQRGYLAPLTASVVAGPQMPARDFARLADLAATLPGVTLVRFRRDLESHVAAADAVVTMGGYNSVWEAVGAGKRPIVSPRGGGSDEQPLRAERLAALGLASVVPPEELTPARLAEAINAELARSFTPAIDVDFDGLERTGKALEHILRRRLDGAEPVGAKGRGAMKSTPMNGSRKKHKTSSRTTGSTTTPLAQAPIAVSPQRTSSAEVVICVHDAIDDVRRCLAAFVRHTDARHRLLLVDDASGPECREELDRFAATHPLVTLLRQDERLGYTRSANRGLRHSRADVVVMLNSDTVVTPGWLERLLECAASDPRIGIVSPLSNAASFQSVPERYDGKKGWHANPLPPEWEPDAVAAAIAAIAPRAFPRVDVLNGFCMAIKRAVIETIGYFDEEAYPDGYVEDLDYCFRAAKAGFALAVADHAYVYHAENQSYGSEKREELKVTGRAALIEKHSGAKIRAAIRQIDGEPTLALMREHVARLLREAPPAARDDHVGGDPAGFDAAPETMVSQDGEKEHRQPAGGSAPESTSANGRLTFDASLSLAEPTVQPISVLFLLPYFGVGGGAHSVVQEAVGMRRLGIKAQVAVIANHLPLFRESYAALDTARKLFFGYATPEELQARASRFAVVVATFYASVPLLAELVANHPHILPAYYVQDYEPYFFPEGSPHREEAMRSYTRIPDAVLFAKTQWVCDIVRQLHGVNVHKVSPSLDRDVFYPRQTSHGDSRVRVGAMIRPSSLRRGPARTMHVLRQLTMEFATGVDVHTFGCTKKDLKAAKLRRDFAFTHHGILEREEVAQLLREADVFLDLSDYQAFGRTGLEAMACGAAVVLPALGGTNEYAVDRQNALLVDTSSLDACYQAAKELISNSALREQLQRDGELTARRFTIDDAARSEIELLSRKYAEKHPEFVPVDQLQRASQTYTALLE